MQIAFYAPLKSPTHPVPSGDRLMARLLIAALERSGHQVTIASHLRSFSGDPQSGRTLLAQAAEVEAARISNLWHAQGRPDLWLCYHPYYKATDLMGPGLARSHGIPYVTVEASYSARRNLGDWGRSQAGVLDAVRFANVNICMTERDRQGLARAAPDARLARLAPFIDPSPFLRHEPAPRPGALATVAMMRKGDKMDSYVFLAEALGRLGHLDWTLSIIGSGPCRDDVEALFAAFEPGRVIWQGERTTREVAALLSQASVYVWPGCGEAYGLAYLEAQAAGLPVAAQRIAGVPEVVEDGVTGVLTPPGDSAAYADAIARLLADEDQRAAMSRAARTFVAEERSLDRAALRLQDIFDTYLETGR